MLIWIWSCLEITKKPEKCCFLETVIKNYYRGIQNRPWTLKIFYRRLRIMLKPSKLLTSCQKKRKLLAVRFVLSGKISILSNSLSVNKFFLSMKIIRKARNGYICFALYNTQSLCLVIWFFLNTRQFLIT